MFRNLAQFRHDPFMFHQANMRFFPYKDQSTSLLTWWVDRIVDSVLSYFTIPSMFQFPSSPASFLLFALPFSHSLPLLSLPLPPLPSLSPSLSLPPSPYLFYIFSDLTHARRQRRDAARTRGLRRMRVHRTSAREPHIKHDHRATRHVISHVRVSHIGRADYTQYRRHF